MKSRETMLMNRFQGRYGDHRDREQTCGHGGKERTGWTGAQD